ncbi:MAG: CHAT domain-containing protein, partial [Blastocatellia bacterium]
AANIPLYVGKTYIYRGMLLGDVRRYDEGVQSLQEALKIGDSLAGDPLGQGIQADAELALGHLYRMSGDNRSALASYDRSIKQYTDLNYPALLYDANKGKLMSLIAVGDKIGAENQIPIVVRLFEAYRTKIIEESNRNTFFDSEQNTYDLIVGFEFDAVNHPDQALNYVEASRARSLFDLMSTQARPIDKGYGPDLEIPSVAPSLNVSEIQRRLPPNSQILEYSVLDKHAIAWVISRDELHAAPIEIEANTLSGEVHEFQRCLGSQSEAIKESTRALGKHLYDILIRPVEQWLDPNKIVCVVPDKSLGSLAFEALVSPTHEYMLEKYISMSSPSASVFITASEAAQKKENSKRETILCVGNPKYDRTEYPSLDDITSSREEAEKTVPLYDAAELLTDSADTKDAIIAAISKVDVVDLALHYLPDKNAPMQSRVVLAKNSAG